MATKLGTAYVDIQPDFSAFDRLVAQKLGSSLAKSGEQSGRDFSKGFDAKSSGLLIPISRALRDVGTDATDAGKDAKRFGRETADAAGAAQTAIAKIGQAISDVPALDIPLPDLSRTGRIDLQIQGASADVSRLRAKIKELTAQPETVDVRADVGSAVAALDRAEAKVRKLHEQRAGIDVDLSKSGRLDLQIQGASSDVSRLRAEVDALTAAPQTVDVRADVTRAVAELDRAEAKLKDLRSQRADINVKVPSGIVSAMNAVSDSAKGMFASLGGGGGGGLNGVTTRVSAGFISFGVSLGPVAIAVAGLAVTIGVALVGALAALAASLALAAAGALALGVAMGGILGASLTLLIPVAVRLGKVFESLKADNAATDAIGRNAAEGSRAAAAAATAQAAAQRGLTEATRQMGVASKAAYREMADAAEAASDAVRGVATAQLSLDQAKLSTEQAKLELEKFRGELGATSAAFGDVFQKFTDVAVDTSGLRQAITDAQAASGKKLDGSQELELRQKILDVRAARLREKEAIDGVSDAQRNATRTQERHNEFVKQGRIASEGYRGALRGVEAATLAVAAASEQQGAGIAAQEKAEQLAGRLTKAEIRLKETIVAVGKALRGAFTPATDSVIAGLTTGLSRMPALINPLRGAFARLGEAWKDAIEIFSADLIRPDSVGKMRAFTDAAAKLAGPVTRGISALLDILTDIARAALPFLIRGTTKVADKLEEWAKGTANAEDLDKAVGGLVGHLKTWLSVGTSIADVFLAFLGNAAGPGKNLAENIKNIADKTAAWLRSDAGREALKKFFKDTIGFAKQVVGFLGDIIAATVKFGQKASPILKDVFDAFGDVVGAVKSVIGWFKEHDTVSTALLVTLGGFAAAFAALAIGAGAATLATGLLSGAVSVLTAVLFANPIGLIAAAVIGLGAALVIAYKRSETFRRIVDGAFAAVKKAASVAFNFIKDNWEKLLVILTGPIGLAVVAIVKNFDTIERAARKALRFLISLIDGVAGAWSTMLTALSTVPGFGWAKRAAELIDKARGALRKLTDGLEGVSRLKDIKINVKAKIDPKLKRLLDLPQSEFGVNKRPVKRARGGSVPGTGYGDKIHILAEPQEFVIRRSITEAVGANVMSDINTGRLDPRVGYGINERASGGPVVANSGPRFGTGGLVGVGRESSSVTNNITAPITVPGGGPPDPVALGVALARTLESRAGGSPRD